MKHDVSQVQFVHQYSLGIGPSLCLYSWRKTLSRVIQKCHSASFLCAQNFGTKEATNNFFVAPQPKGRQAGGSGSDSEGSAAARQMSLLGILMRKVGISSGSVAQAHSIAATPSHTAVSSGHTGASAVTGHGGGHDSHAAPWEGVNLWRTPYKGDGDTVTQVKRNKGVLDRYVEKRTRHIQQMQLMALVSRK